MVSLLNGLSSLGQGVSAFAGTAGLEAQKSDLARQQIMLADQLATTRESAGRQEAGQIAEAAQGRQQTFAAGEGEKTRAATAALQQGQQTFAAEQQGRQQAFAGAEGEKTRAAEMEREMARINAPPDVIKVLRAFGQMPDPNAPASTSGGGNGGSAPSTDSSGTPQPTTTGQGPDLSNPLVAKALGLPMAGSEDAIRRAIADDVSKDPAFKYKTVGQKAAEIESRLAVAGGKMTDPSSRKAMAAAIASYQLAPLTNFALTKAGGPETMAEAMQINPDYQEGRYPEVTKAMTAFGTGPQGNIIRSLNVGVQHLDVLDQAGKALANNNIQALNSLQNMFQQQFGAPEPTTFDGLKQIVGTEIEKAVAGGVGAAADRDRIMKALDRANSPTQLQAITDGFRALMVGQLSGLKTQYEEATSFKDGPFAFEKKLVPATIKALGLHSDDTAANPPPPTPSNTAAGPRASTAADPLAMARDAISRGAPRDAVLQRLRDNGINPSGL